MADRFGQKALLITVYQLEVLWFLVTMRDGLSLVDTEVWGVYILPIQYIPQNASEEEYHVIFVQLVPTDPTSEGR